MSMQCAQCVLLFLVLVVIPPIWNFIWLDVLTQVARSNALLIWLLSIKGFEIYCICSIRGWSQLIIPPPDVLNKIVATFEYWPRLIF